MQSANTRKWVGTFVRWYNEEHRHSAIKFVTPAQRHAGLERHHYFNAFGKTKGAMSLAQILESRQRKDRHGTPGPLLSDISRKTLYF
ncbi:hypothetical protein [Massilia polaris]|uniref:hypothetical protein n=1 Tax=Massilia polaris TaxID=2728846 RepID=UPI00146F7934|nr:hypothetical protein [Massilia polaris]